MIDVSLAAGVGQVNGDSFDYDDIYQMALDGPLCGDQDDTRDERVCAVK